MSDESDERYELKRLRMENFNAGELLSEIARELGCMNSNRESILRAIAELKEKSGRRDATAGEGRSAQIVRSIANEIGAVSLHGGAILNERLVDRVKDLMTEVRRYRQQEIPVRKTWT